MEVERPPHLFPWLVVILPVAAVVWILGFPWLVFLIEWLWVMATERGL